MAILINFLHSLSHFLLGGQAAAAFSRVDRRHGENVLQSSAQGWRTGEVLLSYFGADNFQHKGAGVSLSSAHTGMTGPAEACLIIACLTNVFFFF